jgi:ubiquinone biosynthesis protein
MAGIGSYFRLARDGWVLVREGVISEVLTDELGAPAKWLRRLISPVVRRRDKNPNRRDRLAKGIGRLGPSYVKLGQFLATRPDLVGAEIAAI